jgi:hypothetical protein
MALKKNDKLGLIGSIASLYPHVICNFFYEIVIPTSVVHGYLIFFSNPLILGH